MCLCVLSTVCIPYIPHIVIVVTMVGLPSVVQHVPTCGSLPITCPATSQRFGWLISRGIKICHVVCMKCIMDAAHMCFKAMQVSVSKERSCGLSVVGLWLMPESSTSTGGVSPDPSTSNRCFKHSLCNLSWLGTDQCAFCHLQEYQASNITAENRQKLVRLCKLLPATMRYLGRLYALTVSCAPVSNKAPCITPVVLPSIITLRHPQIWPRCRHGH